MWHCAVIYSEMEELKSLPGLLNTTPRIKTGIITEEIRGQKWFTFIKVYLLLYLLTATMKSLCSLNVISGSERHLVVKKYLKEHLKQCITQSLLRFYKCHYDSPQYLHNVYCYVPGNPIHSLEVVYNSVVYTVWKSLWSEPDVTIEVKKRNITSTVFITVAHYVTTSILWNRNTTTAGQGTEGCRNNLLPKKNAWWNLILKV